MTTTSDHSRAWQIHGKDVTEDFKDEKQRAKCRQMIIEEKPSLLVGSPMCTIFNALQNLNRPKMGEAKWKIAWDHGMKHLLFAFEMYEIQIKAGRYFLHEHPNSATSWHVPEIVQLMSKYDLTKTTVHMCMYGMRGKDKIGEGPIKKPTGWLTNSDWITSAM